MSYFNAIRQNVIADTNNELIAPPAANLNAGATFTGTGSSTLGVAGIQVSLKADQNCTVTVEQSPDNINWDISDEFEYLVAVGSFGITVQAVNSYVRVKLTNDGAVATTYIRLQTALCPIVEALPRALSPDGYLQTHINKIECPEIGVHVLGSPMGEIRVTEHIRLAGTTFNNSTFDTNFWTKTSQVGTGDAAQSSGQLVLSTGVTANSSIVVNSVRTARYVGSFANFYRGVIRTPAIVGSNVRRWGAFNANNGFFFEYDGTTLSVISRKATVDTPVSSGSFNGNYGLTYVLDANVHTFEIYWTNSSAWFLIDNVLVHKLSGSTTTLSASTDLQVGMECTNSGGNINNNTLEVRVSTISRLGPMETENTYRNIVGAATTILKYGAGRLHTITLNKATGTSITVYDNTAGSGTKIATIDPSGGGTLVYNCPFNTGLTIVSVGLVDVTVIYE